MGEEREGLEDTARHAREVFDASIDSLDEATRARLGEARRAAVAKASLRGRTARWVAWAPVTAVASIVAVAVLLWRTPDSADPMAVAPAEGEPSLEAVDVLVAGEDLDLVENDLEFYQWLDATRFADPGAAG